MEQMTSAAQRSGADLTFRLSSKDIRRFWCKCTSQQTLCQFPRREQFQPRPLSERSLENTCIQESDGLFQAAFQHLATVGQTNGSTALKFGSGDFTKVINSFRPDTAYFVSTLPSATGPNHAPGDIKPSWKWSTAMAFQGIMLNITKRSAR
ncbi:hypothetical protein Aspvir_003599 [Aspergillus viridinutans]|uniref:Uncharacterized protein n=1 Tax=Aspergillus viridinutans TaxID=75553 RepID=A0A9P3BNS3_ASPVI|nr:uncharacterized protein Aspvir_003599 [Aspergillus viridinutans]GIJ99598.1 hypothetical protein Aspvir_003599 [Aspergillus viridinutans]